jgi:hypothetical protein
MRRVVAGRLVGQRRDYGSMAGFYAADERRLRSRERDLGLWWRDGGDGPLHRAAWIEDTGELYLVRLGPEVDGGGQVEVLATARDFERVQGALDGWRERCGELRSLSWLRERAAALRLPASGDSAPARPRELAPTARLSPRTSGIAAARPDRGRVIPA